METKSRKSVIWSLVRYLCVGSGHRCVTWAGTLTVWKAEPAERERWGQQDKQQEEEEEQEEEVGR